MNTLQFQRCLHKTCARLFPRAPRGANPGIGYQVQGLDDGKTTLTSDPEGFGDLESDFMSVQHTHRAHETEMQDQRERIRQYIIKRKYFPGKQLPNLLTYSEKEQIRLLHARDAEEWTVERLAESFPASPDVIKKILSAKWRPRATKRIREHDEAVIRNWTELRSGECKTPIPQELKEHLEKFANRQLSDLETNAEQWPTRPKLPTPKGTEFQSLITSCKKYAPRPESEQKKFLNAFNEKPAQSAHSDEETYLLAKVQNKRNMRLQELKEAKLVPNENIGTHETPNNPSDSDIVKKPDASRLPSFVEKFESSEIVISAAEQKRFEMSKVKDRIHIPRKLWQRGATYRVEDAYYDDDGELLYRVPGMTTK